MCGRFGLEFDNDFYPRFNVVNHLDNYISHYNITPGQEIVSIRAGSIGNEVTLMKWGLVPFWAKDTRLAYKMINARIETIQEKPAYRKAIQSQRCLIPASGYYEWSMVNGTKKPFFIQSATEKLLAFAGIFDIWKENDETLITCSILTQPSSSDVAKIHHRMPVILTRDFEDKWLLSKDIGPTLREVSTIDTKLTITEVSSLVNSPKNDFPELMQPVSFE